MSRTKVLLIDRDSLVRGLLVDHLQRDPMIEVAVAAGDADEVTDRRRDLAPDVVVISADRPGRAVSQGLRRARDAFPGARLIFLAPRCLDRDIDEVLRAGVSGFLTAADSPSDVAVAIRGVARGETVLSEAVRDRLIVKPGGLRRAPKLRSRLSGLSQRELEVLKHLGRGFSPQQTASLLNIGHRTVEKHTQHIMRKLDIHDRVELVRYAIREGICSA